MEVARTDSALSSSSTDSSSSISGYLLKKSGKKRVTWKERWFVLRTEVLLYYEHDRAISSKGTLDLRDSRGLRKSSEIKSIKNLPKSANRDFVFGIAAKKKVFVVCAPDADSYRDWTWALHTAITQSNPEVVQQSLGQFIGNRVDPFVFLGDDANLDESDSSSGEDCYVATKESSKDLEGIQRSKVSQGRDVARRTASSEQKVRLVQTPGGLKMSKSNTTPNFAPKFSNSLPGYDKTANAPASKWNSPKYALRDRFTSTTDWQEQPKSAPTTPTSSRRPVTSGFATVGRRSQGEKKDLAVKRVTTPLGRVRSSLSKLAASSSMSDLRDLESPQPDRRPFKRSSSGDSEGAEQRTRVAVQECRDEVAQFQNQVQQFLGKSVEVEHDLTRLVEEPSLDAAGVQRFKGLRESVRSVLQNLFKGLVTVAEPSYVREEAARVLGKFQFTLYQIPHNLKAPNRPASSLMLQSLKGRALDWDCPDPPASCCLHYYLQMQMEKSGKRVLDIMTVFQCELFWENLLRGWESKFSLQIESGVLRWQTDLEKYLGRSVGVFVDTVALLREVPEQALRYKAAKAVGNDFCKDSLGRIVGILQKLADSGLTKIQLRKRLRYIELGPLPADSKEEKRIQWCAGGLLVLAKWQNGVSIEYADVFQCLECDTALPN